MRKTNAYGTRALVPGDVFNYVVLCVFLGTKMGANRFRCYVFSQTKYISYQKWLLIIDCWLCTCWLLYLQVMIDR